MTEPHETDDPAYLRDLAERLMHVPVMFGTDQHDTDRLCEIASRLRTEMGTSALLGHKAADRLTDNDPLSPVDEGRNSGQK